MPNTTIALPHQTERLRLRRFTGQDLARFQQYRHDPEVQRYQGWRAQTDELALQFLHEMQVIAFFSPGKWCQMAVALQSDDGLIGDIGVLLAEDGTSATLGYTFATRFQGQGYATEAVRAVVALLFADSALEQIHASTDLDNHPSHRLLQRLGMRAGEQETVEFHGVPCIECHYHLSRTDFLQP
jgi:RimJ/RimL family protein N-acetyltransferase